jgi:hypothetical protein
MRLEELAGQLTDELWATFTTEPSRVYGVGYHLRPMTMSFEGRDGVRIKYSGQIALLSERPDVRLPEELRPPGIPFPGPVPQIGGEIIPPIGDLRQNLLLRRTSSFNAGVHERWAGPASSPGMLLNAERIPGLFDTEGDEAILDVQEEFGVIEVTLKARYKSVEHVPQKCVDIFLDLNGANLEILVADGDAKLLYDTFLASLEYRLATQFMPHAAIQLTPTISLVGHNAANVAVSELNDFEVRLFHVGIGSRQAICAAFDVQPGCKGIVEDVEYFIGWYDYGVIHDEYVVERVMRHKWSQGGFDRSLAIDREVSIRVKRDGKERDEDAIVYGRLLMDSLDVVALEPHADLRGDLLYFSGQARGVADRVVLLTDGTVLTPENADLGPQEAASWAVNVVPSLTVPWEPDPELREFQSRAHTDGIRHLSRPFARFPELSNSPAVGYARTEAILKRVFFLGQLPGVFM